MRRLNTLIVGLVVGSLIAGPTSPVRAGEAEARKKVVAGNNEFACDLYAKLRGQDGNLFFSPYSISTALAMTYAGARGNTAKQMADVLHFTVEGDDLHRAMGGLVDDLNEAGEKGAYDLTVANALWAQKGYRFLDAFTNLVTESYDAGLNLVNFAGATEPARKTINHWVEEKTNDKIKDLLKRGILNHRTRLVLTNAIYFKGNWASQFEEKRTKDRPFTLADGTKKKAPMMYQREEFRHGANELCQTLELPYEGEDLSMLVLLPKTIDGLPALEKKLSPDQIETWAKRMRKREVRVHLPKFKMTREFNLGRTLQAMGMTDAFSPAAADLSGMDGSKRLFISDVVHKAFVDVNEEGTEAAAATAVAVEAESVGPLPVTFRADHPFLFLIRDNRTGSLLFLGRVSDPTAGD
ncbi:MAG: serpin family protein [Planctomycetota bacterium]